MSDSKQHSFGAGSEDATNVSIASGWDDPTSWGICAEDRKKVFALYREARPVATQVLELREEFTQTKTKTEDVRQEITTLNNISESEEEGLSMEDLQRREDRFDNLQAQIPHLRADLSRLLREINLREGGLRELSEKCSMLLLPPYANLVMAKLPPLELRNHIYDYLWDEKATDLVDSQISGVPDGQSDLRFAQDWVARAPCFADAIYVGEAFARETATLFWRLITDAEVHYRLVRPFLAMPSFGNISLRPRDIIRRLVIDIGFAQVGYYRINVIVAELVENLESLLSLPVKEDFELVIYFAREIQFSRTLFKALEAMKPIYYALVQKGMKVRVLGFQFFTPAWRNPDDIREEPTIRKPCTTAEQLNYYLEMTPYEWLDMKEGEINEIRQPVRRGRCMEILNNMRVFVAEMESWTEDPEMEKELARLTPKPLTFDEELQMLV